MPSSSSSSRRRRSRASRASPLSYYAGPLLDGLPHGANGVGKTRDASTGTLDVYEGEWQSGTYHGTGTLFRDGRVLYRGGWRRGRKHGRGVYRGAFDYKGEWRDDLPHGKGIMTRTSGGCREMSHGEWMAGQLHGEGTFVLYAPCAAPVVATGRFEHGKFVHGELHHGDRVVGAGAFDGWACQAGAEEAALEGDY